MTVRVAQLARHHGPVVRRIIDQHVSAQRRADGSVEYDVVQASFDNEEEWNFAGELYGAPVADGLPLTTKNQHCPCSAEPVWVYRVAREDREFRVASKTFTLPSFVTLCATCKDLAEQRDATGLLERLLGREGDSDWDDQIAESSAAALARAHLTAGRSLQPASSD